MKILLYANRWCQYGGWPTFTKHLMEGLKDAGNDVIVGSKEAPTGAKDWVQKMSHQDAFDTGRHVIIVVAPGKAILEHVPEWTAMAKNGRLTVVIHDPTEYKPEVMNFLHYTHAPIFYIRDKVARHAKSLQFNRYTVIPHPYKAEYNTGDDGPFAVASGGAFVCTSRIDHDKRTQMILDADCGVELWSAYINRIYEYHTLRPLHGKLVDHPSYKGGFETPADVMKGAWGLVDMSVIVGDGGGTQYTFLEAADYGLWIVLNSDWFDGKPGEMVPGENCITVDTPEALRAVVSNFRGHGLEPYDRKKAYNRLLTRHDHIAVGLLVSSFLDGSVPFNRRPKQGFVF